MSALSNIDHCRKLTDFSIDLYRLLHPLKIEHSYVISFDNMSL